MPVLSLTKLYLILFQVSVTAREDVPHFGPKLPNPAVFKKVCAHVISFRCTLKLT